MIPGGEIASGVLSLIGITFTVCGKFLSNTSHSQVTQATAQNMDEEETEKPEYLDLASELNSRLGKFFTLTQSSLDESLLDIFGVFGDGRTAREESTKRVRKMIEGMSKIGARNMNKDAKSPIAELLKGGQWFTRSNIEEAMNKAFATTQQGLISHLLATLHVYVEQEMPAYNEGLVQPCTALGTLREGNSCHVIKIRPFEKGSDAQPLDDKYLRLMGEYGIDLHTLIRSVRDCNNDKADPLTPRTDGTYPPCFFGMNFAQRVHDKDRNFQDRVNSGCVSYYQNQKNVPDWITDKFGYPHCDNEIPKWKPCKVTFE